MNNADILYGKIQSERKEGKERYQVKSEISLQHWNEEMIM
jgi:hypothetical protein